MVAFNTDEYLSIDVESTGLYNYHGCFAFLISTCESTAGKNYTVEMDVDPLTRIPEWDRIALEKLYKRIKQYKIFVFHNCLYDLVALRNLPYVGQKIFDWIMANEFHDTMFSAHIVDSQEPKGLKDQAMLRCDILDEDEKLLDKDVQHVRNLVKREFPDWARADEDIPELAGQTSKWHKADMWILRAYAKAKKLPKSHPYWTRCRTYADLDTWRTIALRTFHISWFEEHPQYLHPYMQNIRTVGPVLRMQDNGVPLSQKHFKPEFNRANKVRNKAIAEMQAIAWNKFGIENFNYASSKQLPDILFNRLGFEPIKKTKSGKGFAADKTVLPLLGIQDVSKTAHAFLESLLTLKEVDAAVKYMNSYKRFHIDWVLYPSYNIVGTSTVRFSCSNPNGQNIGKGKEYIDEDGNVKIAYSIRKVFGPDENHYWASIDYDQQQLRIFAYWSKEPILIKAFESGFDFHTYMAMLIFEVDEPTKIQRRIAKNVNFGYIFGAGAAKIDATAGIPGLFDRVSKLFPNVTEQIKRTVRTVKQFGYVETASGYKLTVPKRKAYAGVNYIVQGTEGDIVKKAFIDLDKYLQDKKSSIKTILQVHDEFVFQFPKRIKYASTLSRVAKIMEEASLHYGVPTKCKPELYTDNWATAEPFNHVENHSRV